MDIFEIIKKYNNEGIDVITREEIEYICNYFEDTSKISKLNDDDDDLIKVNRIMYKYCTKYNDSDLALSFVEKEYEYDTFNAMFEFLAPYVNYQLNNNNTDIFRYDNPYFNYCFAEKSDNKDKKIEYYKKGASQHERYCIAELLRYYVDDPESFIEPPIDKIDFENALYYAQLSYNLFNKIDSFYFNTIFEELEKLPDDEKNKYNSIINNSRELLYERFLVNEDSDDRESFYDSLYDCSVSSILKYQKASQKLDLVNNYCCIYNNDIFDEDISKINEFVVKENIEELSKYSAKELFCYGVYYLKKKLLGNAYIAFKVATLKGNEYAMYAIGLNHLTDDSKKDLEYLIKTAELGCLSAVKVILYNEEFISQCPEKREQYINFLYENSTHPADLYEIGVAYRNGWNYVKKARFSEKNRLDGNYIEALKFFEKAQKYGYKGINEDILTLRYINDEKVDFKEYLNLASKEITNNYFKKINKLSDDGSNVVCIDLLNKCRELRENNPDSNTIDLLINYVNSLDDNTIINVKQSSQERLIIDLYDIKDFKEILKVCKTLLRDIDINQKPEDIFMQIYIKVGNVIEYDFAELNDEYDCNNEAEYTKLIRLLMASHSFWNAPYKGGQKE